MENFSYLFAAYTVTWIVLFGYILRLHHREKNLRQKMDELEKLLGRNRHNSDF